MEAGIKKEQGNTEIFREIGAVEALNVVASCPNAIASKFAAQALRLIGEEVPHKLSQQVPLWSVEDVREWVKQIGFAEYERNFYDSRVDGDLLLQLNEENLRDDIGETLFYRRLLFFVIILKISIDAGEQVTTLLVIYTHCICVILFEQFQVSSTVFDAEGLGGNWRV